MAQRVIPDPTLLAGSRRRAAAARPLPTVPARLASVLHRAKVAEQVATGADRVPAFRLTRSLIAGARYAGCTDAALATCLGSSVSSVQSRGTSDGWVAVDEFIDLADLAPDIINQWAAAGQLSHTATDDGRRYYAATELMLALTRTDPSAGEPAPANAAPSQAPRPIG